MPSFKSKFSQFPRFVQEGGSVYAPDQMPSPNMPSQFPPEMSPQMPQQNPLQMMPEQAPPEPPSQMPPVGQSYEQPYIPPERKSPLKAILISLLAVLILAGAGFAIVLATRIWDPMWNPFRPNPETVFKQALLKLNDVKKYGYNATGKISLGATDVNSKAVTFQASINSKGEIDISDILNPKFNSILDFAVNLSTSDPREGTGIASTGEVRSVDKNLYFKISKFEAAGSAIEDFKDYVSFFESIKDKWIKITKDKLASLSSQGQVKNNLSDAQQKELEVKIASIFQTYPIWQTAGQFPDEKIGTQNVYHYLIALNKENLKKAFSEIMKAGANEAGKNEGNNQAVDYFLGMVEGLANTFFEKMGDVKADVWIGKKDLLVYKIDFEKTFDLKQILGSITGSFGLNMDLQLFDHNKPVTVNIPLDAKDYDEVFGPFVKKIGDKAKNDKIQSDIDQIKAIAGTMIASKMSYYGLNCKAKDVIGLCDDIKTQTGEDPKVFGYYKRYCAYSKLLKLNDGDKQEYYCVDYNLSAIRTDIDPSQRGYCTGYAFECPKPSPSPSPIISPSPSPSITPIPSETPLSESPLP